MSAGEAILLVNPRRKRRRKSAARRTSRRARSRTTRIRRRRLRAVNPRRHRARHVGGYKMRRRRRRNPRALGIPSVRGILGQLIPAATGAVGAVGLDLALAYIPIPDQYKTGWLGTGVKVAGAIGLGLIAGKVVGKQKGHLFTAGALTVIAYQVIRKLAQDSLPATIGAKLSGGDFADVSLGAYMRPALPAPQMNGMGAYMNPAAILNGLDGGQSGGDSGYYGF